MTKYDPSRAVEPLFYRAPHPQEVTPYEYQLAGVEYHLARDHALFGDEPGLGKSAECVLVGNTINAQRTLVICPASLRLNWEREVRAWSTIPRVETYPVLSAKDGISPTAHYVITSYSMLQNKDILAAILALRWDHLILDEAHALKDPKGNRRTKAICGGMTKGVYHEGVESVVGRITMASGTILPNQPIECYNAIRLLDWDAIDRASLADFREHYYEMGEGFVTRHGKPEWSNRVRNVPCNLGDLQTRLRKCLMVRRLKAQVLHELPPKQWHLFPLEATGDMKAALEHEGWGVVAKMWELNPNHFEGDTPIDGAVSTARRLLGEAKAPAVADYARELLRSGVQKLVIAAWHHSVLDYLREELKEYGVAYMDGSTSAVARQREVDRFQTLADYRVILGQAGPLGEGWNLHAAQDVLLAEPDWVPGRNDQILDRTHRIGQTGSYVIGHVPVVPGTLDERILSRAVEKDRSIYEALDNTT